MAVVPIYGVIAHRTFEASSGMTSTERIGASLRAVMADPDVSTVIVDVASQGGTVTGIPELAADIHAARKSKYLVAIANGEMHSAAYWLASQAHEVVSIPSGRVGSIGVYMLHEDLTGMLEQEGIKLTAISAGDYKLELAPWAPLTAEAKARLKGEVDAVYQGFTAAVARGRGVPVADVRGGYGKGRSLRAIEALAAGLIDGIETVPHLLARLARGERMARTARVAASEPAPIPLVADDVAALDRALALYAHV